jgi:signal transduction histidine kinase
VQMQLAHANRVAPMGQLTASIAHAVNQPIAATVTNAEAALRWLGHRPPDLDEVRQAVARIVNDGHRAGEVIRRIRALINKAPPKDPLNINEAIREVIVRASHSFLVRRLRVIELTGGQTVKNDVSGPTATSASESDHQRRRGHDRHQQGSARAVDQDRKAEAVYVLVAVRESGSGPGPEACGPPVRALLHDQGQRDGHGPSDLPFDHRGARGAAVGLHE